MIIVDKNPIIIIYANYTNNKTVFLNRCGNVPSIVQQISNIVEFSTNIILVTDVVLHNVLNNYIDCSKLNILNSTEFLYFIATLENLHVIFIDACTPYISKQLLTEFYKEYKTNTLKLALVPNQNNMFTEEFNDILYEENNGAKTLYKDGLLFCSDASKLLNVFISDPSINLVDFLNRYIAVNNTPSTQLDCFIVPTEYIPQFINISVPNNSNKLKDMTIVV